MRAVGVPDHTHWGLDSERGSCVHIWGNSTPGSGRITCKGPWAGLGLAWRKSKAAWVARTERARGRRRGREGRGDRAGHADPWESG